MQDCSVERIAKRLCVLIVEDDASINEMLQQVLDWEGYNVVTAESGKDALARLLGDTISASNQASCDPIDLILLDLQMPEMNGEDLIAQLQAYGYTVPPIVVVSARREHTVETTAQAIGAAEFLLKPFQINDLLDSMQRALRSAA